MRGVAQSYATLNDAACSSFTQKGINMIRRLATAVALSFALSTVAAPAFAETQFRTAEPQTFTAQELQTYGLDAQTTERAMDLQNQGYEIRVLSQEEAAQYQAGITDSQWIWLGILAGVIVIAVAVSD